MRLIAGLRRTHWIALSAAWIIVAVLLGIHVTAVRAHVDDVDRLGLRGAQEASTPFTMAYPSGAVDAQEWVRYAYALRTGHSLRLGHTDVDNAPVGREVYWNSGWAWIIAGAGWLQERLTGESTAAALERATLWLGPAVLFVAILLLSSFATRRAGAVIGVAIAIAMLGHPQLYSGFSPGDVHHLGILTALTLAMTLGAACAGGGWWRPDAPEGSLMPRSPDAARRAAIISACCGAAAVWISAASAIPPIGMVGVSGALATVFGGRAAAKRGLQYDGRVWRTWGRIGAIACICFYVLEYFPSRLGLRMEVNNPLYALAWWGGGELIAEITERWLAPAANRWKQPSRVFTASLLVLMAPVTVVVGGSAVFTPLDPFLHYIYHDFLVTFWPIVKVAAYQSWNPYDSIIGITNLPLLVGIGVLAVRGRSASPLLWFMTLATLVFTAVGWWQNRWMLNASGPQICLALVLVADLTVTKPVRAQWATTLAAFGIVFLPHAFLRISQTTAQVETKQTLSSDDMMVMYRDMAAALRASQPTGDITLLASANTSISTGYYGQFKTIGTTYWEDLDGLKAAADIFAAPTPEKAAALIRARHITHVAIVTEDDFTAVYYKWLHPSGTEEGFEYCFGYQLATAHNVPSWLQMIPYDVPADLGPHTGQIMLYKVNFDQKPVDALYNAAVSELTAGNFAVAQRDFDQLMRLEPNSERAWLGKSELEFGRQDWSNAVADAVNGIARAPSRERTGLFGTAASNFLRAERTREAMTLYRAALRETFDADIACSLAFALATSKQDSLRDGNEALGLAQRAVATKPNSPMYLDCLGVALAELHRFDEAAKAVDRAMAEARTAGDAGTAEVSGQLLQAFRAGHPWRE